MTDFSALYDQFLGLIENDVDRAEVKGIIAKMCGTDVESPVYKQSRRQLVRVLKSRAPHALPQSWLLNPALENGPTVTPSDEIRKDWKAEMETEGVFFFGHLPTWEDIDKHYGTKGWGGDHRHPPAPGPDKRGVKPPHAPNQKPHGNDVGVRHMVVRLAALPEFRDKIERLAEAVGRPGASYRELVQYKGDDAYRQRLQEVYDGKFPAGSELREAADEGAQMGGENFKLSAGRGRGRRADEHQDPQVDAVDAGPAIAEAKETIADPERGVAFVDDAAKRLLALEKDFSKIKTGATIMKRMRSAEAKLRSDRSRYQRLRNSGASREEKLAAAQKVHDSAQDLLAHMGVLQEQLADRADLREAIATDDKSVEFLNKHLNGAHAAVALTRAMLFTAKHEWNVNDAQEHERPAGPDEGADQYSFYGVPLNELEQMWDDLREAGVPGRLEFNTRSREDRTPAPEAEAAPQAAPATPESAAPEAPAAPTPAAPSRSDEQREQRQREQSERMRERGVRLRPEFQGEAEDDTLVPKEDRLNESELREALEPILREQGLQWASAQAPKNFLDVVNDKEVGGQDAKRSALTDLVENAGDKFFISAASEPAPAKPTPAPAVKPTRAKPAAAGSAPEDTGDRDWTTVSGAMPENANRGMMEVWRNQIAGKIKDEGKAAAKIEELESKLAAVKADDKLAAQEAFIDILEDFIQGNDLPGNMVTRWRENLKRAKDAAARRASKKNVKKRLPMNGTRLPLPGDVNRLDLLPQTTPDP